MDALELLTGDHNEVRGLVKDFESAGGDAAKAAVAARIIALLKVHTAIEEEIFYPAVREEAAKAEDLVIEGVEEHHVVKVLIGEIEALDPSDEAWEAKVTVMTENVDHHAGEEEDEMFPKVRESLGDVRLEELGAQLARRRAELQYESKTRDELYALARERGIEGRSDMTKAEIVAALTDAQAA
jgi:hemerythrin superfamily protein